MIVTARRQQQAVHADHQPLVGLSGLCYNFAKEQQWRFNEGHGEPWLPMAGPSTFHTL